MRICALLPLLGLTAAAAAQPATRPERVLEELRRALHTRPGPSWNSFTLHRAPPRAVGETLVLAGQGPVCGNSTPLWLDLERARQQTDALFALYGYEITRGHDLRRDGAAAHLDGYDATARIGYAFLPRTAGWPDDPVPAARPADQVLDAAELVGLRRGGERLLAVPLDRYWTLGHDDMVARLPFLLSVVRFLDRHTDGPTFDLRGLLAEAVEFEVPEFGAGVSGMEINRDKVSWTVTVERRQRLLLPIRPPEDPGVRRGSPCLVVPGFHWTPPFRDGKYDRAGPQPTFAVKQRRDDGSTSVTSPRAALLTSAGFDPAQPFMLEIDLLPGRAVVGRTIRVHALPVE